MLHPDQQARLDEERAILATARKGSLQWHSARRAIATLEAVAKTSENLTRNMVSEASSGRLKVAHETSAARAVAPIPSSPVEAPKEPGTLRGEKTSELARTQSSARESTALYTGGGLQRAGVTNLKGERPRCRYCGRACYAAPESYLPIWPSAYCCGCNRSLEVA